MIVYSSLEKGHSGDCKSERLCSCKEERKNLFYGRVSVVHLSPLEQALSVYLTKDRPYYTRVWSAAARIVTYSIVEARIVLAWSLQLVN